MENKDFVVCPLCQQKFACINSTHLKKHSISLQEFKIQFPNVVLTSELKREKMSKTSKKRDCGKWFKGRKFSLTRRQQLSESSKGENNNFFGKKHTQETRNLMSKNHANFKGNNNPLKKFLQDKTNHELYCLKIKNAKSRFKKNMKKYKEWRNNISKSVIQGHIDGVYKPYGRGHKQGKFYSKSQEKSIIYRSSYEERFLFCCEKANIMFDTCRTYVKYKNKKNEIHRYLPDFSIFIETFEIVLEIKPENMLKICFEKIKSGFEYFKTKNILYVVLTLKDIEELETLNFFDKSFFIEKSKKTELFLKFAIT